MPIFVTPTRHQAMFHPFWGRFGSEEGVSVVRVDGTLTAMSAPTHEELVAAGVEGVDFFRGGYEYIVSTDVLTELIDAGFVESDSDGTYGSGRYGYGPYGG